MTMQEIFGIAAFRSRQQVMRFDSALNRAGIRSQVISTPRDVAVGCGLSVRFACSRLPFAAGLYNEEPQDNFIGFYVAELSDGKIRISPYRV